MFTDITAAVPDIRPQYISSEVHFYTVADVAAMTGWGENVVLKMFKDPDFPSVDYGKAMVVESHGLIEYFATKRTRDELKTRIGGNNNAEEEYDLRRDLLRRVG